MRGKKMNLNELSQQDLINLCLKYKNKINLQVDELKRLQSEVNSKSKVIDDLVKKNKNQNLEKNRNINFLVIFEVFYDVMSELVLKNAFIETKKITKNTKKFNIIESKLFRDIIQRYIDLKLNDKSVNELVRIWGTVGLLDKDENGNCYFTFTHKKKSIRVARVNKNIIKIIMDSMIHD